MLVGRVAFTQEQARDAHSLKTTGVPVWAIAARLGGCSPWHVSELLKKTSGASA